MGDVKEMISLGQMKMCRFQDMWVMDFLDKTDDDLKAIQDSEMSNDDILLVSYPRSGTGWMARILSLMRVDADVDRADSVPLKESVPFLEMTSLPHLLQTPSPRIINTHFTYDCIPRSFRSGKGKIIYICRNPNDVVVSNFFFFKMVTACRHDMTPENFLDKFISGDFPYGLWAKHVQAYLKHKDDANVLFLQYEDIQKNPKESMERISSFIGKKFTIDQIDAIIEESSFTKMKDNPATNYQWLHQQGVFDFNVSNYYRKGKIGDWKNFYTTDMCQKMNAFSQEYVAPLDLLFHYE